MENYSVQAILSAVDKGFTRTMSAAEKSIEKLESTSTKMSSSYTSAVSSAMKTGIAAVGAAASAFGAYAVSSAADLRVINAQYEQTFKGIEDQADKTVQEMSKTWNMLPNRVKPPLSQFASYFRGTGKEVSEALKTSKTAMQIAADASAYYDKSIEDTSASLKGFLMGNFENGDAIGINTNLTKIGTAYNEKYGASFEDLSEAAKADYLLEYINDIYSLNGVIGQAERESREWENVMGNLKQSVKDLAGAVGEPFMDTLINAISSLTGLITDVTPKITAFADKFKGLDSAADKISLIKDTLAPIIPLLSGLGAGVGLAGILPAVSGISKGFSELSSKIPSVSDGLSVLSKFKPPKMNMTKFAQGFETARGKIGSFRVGFIQLEDVFGGVDKVMGKTGASVIGLQDKFPKLTSAFSKVSSGIGTGLQKSASVGTKAMEGMLSGLMSVMKVALVALGPAAILGVALVGLGLLNSQFGEQIQSMITTVTEKGPEIITNLINGIVSQLPALMTSGTQVLTGLINAITANVEPIMSGAVLLIQTLVQGVIEALPQLIPAALSLVEQLALGIISAAPQLLITGLDLLLALVQGIIDNADQIISVATNIIETLTSNLETNLPLIIDKGIEILTTLAEAIVKVLPQLIPVAFKAITTIVTGLANKLPDIINAAVEIISTLADGLLDNLPEILATGVEMILAIVDGIAKNLPEIVSGGIKIIAKLASTILKGVPDMLSAGKDLVKGFIKGIGDMIGGVVRKAEELASSAVSAVKKFLHIGSPSRLMRQFGKWTGEGFVIGMDSMVRDVEKSAEELANAALPDMQSMEYDMTQTMSGSIGASMAISGGNEPIVVGSDQPIYVTLDGRVIAETTAPFMNDILGKAVDKSAGKSGFRRVR